MDADEPRKINVAFLSHRERQRTGAGLADRSRRGEAAAVGQDLMRVQFRWPVGRPLVRPMGRGLHEVRTSLPDGTIARVMFCVQDGEIYALHGFIKKAQQTPRTDLELARKRQKEIEHG